MIVITNKKTYINGRLIFLKSTHHCWLDLLRWLIEIDKYARESLDDRNRDEPPTSLRLKTKLYQQQYLFYNESKKHQKKNNKDKNKKCVKSNSSCKRAFYFTLL